MKLWDKIKLIIEARSFYVKKIFIPDLDFTHWKGIATGILHKSNPSAQEGNLDGIAYHLNCHFFHHRCVIKRLLQYARDEKRFGWVVWYI